MKNEIFKKTCILCKDVPVPNLILHSFRFSLHSLSFKTYKLNIVVNKQDMRTV